jgi:uncharacterized protein (DUF885 family)
VARARIGALVALAAGLALSGGCRTQGKLDGAMSLSSAHAAAPAASSALAGLAHDYWEARMRGDPVEATLLGDRRYDGLMPDPSDAAIAGEVAALEALRGRVAALDVESSGETDRVTRAALLGEIDNDLATRACRLDAFAVDPREGPQVMFQNLANLQTVTTPAQGRALVDRWRGFAPYLEVRMRVMRRALGEGRVAPRGGVERVLRQLDEWLGQPIESWIIMKPGQAEHVEWSADDRAALREGVAGAARALRPVLEAYRKLLHDELLPAARGDDRPGIRFVPDGEACYRRMIRVHTSLELSADEIHRIGLEENARIRAETVALGRQALGTGDHAEIQRRLRADRSLYFDSREAIVAKAEETLGRARASMSRWLGAPPRTPCEVRRVEPYEEKDTYIAYYRQPALDGSRPGAYYVNTYAPETRPRFEAEVLAFHESIPGHHIQIALAQELQGIPEFRRHLGVTAFVEGWALYTERLADELGLYSGPLDRLGMLSFDAWRASRLVVDTGLHHEGWSRAQAVAYMRENTLLEDNNIENEVDRYIGWPGQALAYKLGQREVWALRREAERRLGAAFDLAAFHDRLLGQGAVSLAVLRGVIERWIAAGGPTARR